MTNDQNFGHWSFSDCSLITLNYEIHPTCHSEGVPPRQLSGRASPRGRETTEESDTKCRPEPFVITQDKLREGSPRINQRDPSA